MYLEKSMAQTSNFLMFKNLFYRIDNSKAIGGRWKAVFIQRASELGDTISCINAWFKFIVLHPLPAHFISLHFVEKKVKT